MRYSILCPSSLVNDKNIKSLVDDYIKRMDATVDFIEVKCKIAASESAQTTMEKQGQALLDSLSKMSNPYIVAMDERGKPLNSPALSSLIEKVTLDGHSHICIVIGGAHGLPQSVLDKSHFRLSLGSMVWPHRLVGLMIAEQLYRAQSISKGHPYHKA